MIRRRKFKNPSHPPFSTVINLKWKMKISQDAFNSLFLTVFTDFGNSRDSIPIRPTTNYVLFTHNTPELVPKKLQK